MKIIFLNTWNATMNENLEAFLAEHLQNTDVFCFQEAGAKIQPLSNTFLPNFNHTFSSKYIDKQTFYHQSTFIRNTIFPLQSSILLQNDSECGLAIYTHLRLHETSIHLVNIHGVARPGNKLDTAHRLRQSSTIINFMQDIPGIKIIGGDFNLEKESKSIAMFTENNYTNLIETFNIHTTRNRLSWDRYPTKQYFADYVFVNDPHIIQQFSVPKNEISDHLPLILEIAL